MKQKLVILSIPLTLILGSCSSADIRAAQNLAKLQDTGKIIFPLIANEVYQSCVRRTSLTPLNIITTTSGQVDKDRSEAEMQCEDDEPAASQAINDVNRVILEYLDALGKLAANDLTNYDSELDNIATSLQKIPGLDTAKRIETINAGSAVANFLSRALINGYRREQLKLAVTTVNTHLQTLVTALNQSVKNHYIDGLLETEKTAVDNYYKNLLEPLSTVSLDNIDPEKLKLKKELDREWKQEKESIRERKSLANDYLSLIKKIASDHQNLNSTYVKGEEISSTQAKQIVDEYTAQLKSLKEKSEKLFPNK